MTDTWNVAVEDDWDFATYGPSGAKGYWDHDSITAGANAPPGPLHNCTFVTLLPTGAVNGTTTYFDETCPKIPWAQRPGSRILLWVVMSFVAIGVCHPVLMYIGYGLAMGVKRVFRPLMPLFKAVRNAWNSLISRVRLNDPRNKADGSVETLSTPAMVTAVADATVLMQFDALPDQAAKVRVEHSTSVSWIEFFPYGLGSASLSGSPAAIEQEAPKLGDSLTVLTKLPISRVPSAFASTSAATPLVLYLEVTIAAASPSTMIAVGLARPPHPSDQLPGNVPGSIGYQSTGKIIQDARLVPTSVPWPTYGVGDVVGVGIDTRLAGTAYFTCNGKLFTILTRTSSATMKAHVAIGATGPCVVEVRWRGPWMWEEAGVKGYRYLPVQGDGVEEEASLELRKDGDDALSRDEEKGVPSAHS
ncbi:Rsp5p-dependent ubiquitination, sorting of cargo proteins at the multivesicular body [Allomyces arbusculus]|nr:Rsp5p-dependent ubiquitination, sorting of cargo proteins at the multivesicular body [Allomyces arbusculus]